MPSPVLELIKCTKGMDDDVFLPINSLKQLSSAAVFSFAEDESDFVNTICERKYGNSSYGDD